MGAFIKTMLACVCGPCRMSPWAAVSCLLICETSCTACMGPALLKPCVILFSKNQGAGIYSRLCIEVTVLDLLGVGTRDKVETVLLPYHFM